MEKLIIAGTHVGDDYGEIAVIYNPLDLLIQELQVNFSGQAHMRFGRPEATRRFNIRLDEPLAIRAPGRHYLQETEEGLELPEQLQDIYIEVVLT